MREEKSMLRLYAGNLWGIVLWLAILTILSGSVAGWISGLSFVRSMTVGGVIAAGIMFGLIAPMVMAGAERQLREVESKYDEAGKELRNMEDTLRNAHKFIKEFVSLRSVLEHMKALQDDYRRRVTQALMTVRDLPACERNSVSKLQEAIHILGRTRDDVSGGEHALREACNLAAKHGFGTSPLEHYLGLPIPGVEGRNEGPGE